MAWCKIYFSKRRLLQTSLADIEPDARIAPKSIIGVKLVSSTTQLAACCTFAAHHTVYATHTSDSSDISATVTAILHLFGDLSC